MAITRKQGESFKVDDTVITVVSIDGRRVTFHVEAPDGVVVERIEISRKTPKRGCKEFAGPDASV